MSNKNIKAIGLLVLVISGMSIPLIFGPESSYAITCSAGCLYGYGGGGIVIQTSTSGAFTVAFGTSTASGVTWAEIADAVVSSAVVPEFPVGIAFVVAPALIIY